MIQKKSVRKNVTKDSVSSNDSSDGTSSDLSMEDYLSHDFLPKKLKRGQVVEGKIISMTDAEVIIDIGARAEAVIAGKELRNEKEMASSFKEGDIILACVAQLENEHGQVVLSLKRAKVEKVWRTLKEAFENKTTVKARVLEFNRGGLVVDAGVKGFIPLSQLSPKYLTTTEEKPDIKDVLEALIGQEIEARVIEFDRRNNKLILAEKSAGTSTFNDFDDASFAKVKVGDEVEGTITRIVPFGILVDIGRIEGLVHISEVSWDRLKKPIDLYKVGDRIKVLILEKNESNHRIQLSIKRLLVDPWDRVANIYTIGQTVPGTVTRITPFGVFVRLEEGIDGLVHSSKLLEGNLELKSGDKGSFKIINLNVPLKRMGLIPVTENKPQQEIADEQKK